MRVLKVLGLSCLAFGVMAAWALFTFSFWALSSMIAFEDDSGRSLVIDIPVLTILAVLAIVVLIAIGKRIALTLKGFRPPNVDPG